ncbi:MAG: hypothetical protein JKY08_09840 [Flavobacteriaceae bacterium]|nr:hypothetical protein [Flavobacteriaceae bacterium]
MKNRVKIVLIAMFAFQFIVSCCNCESSETFENHYSEVSIIAYDTSGFSVVEATENVFKNAFGLGILVGSEAIKVSSSLQFFKELGFGSALAFQCDCDENKFLYPDPLSKLVIYAIDPDTLVKTIVTENFNMRSYDDTFISVDAFFELREEWHDGFQLTLVSSDNLPDQVIFMAEVFLASGKSFTNQTATVHFISN